MNQSKSARIIGLFVALLVFLSQAGMALAQDSEAVFVAGRLGDVGPVLGPRRHCRRVCHPLESDDGRGRGVGLIGRRHWR